MFCKHDWVVLDKETFPAPIDKLVNVKVSAVDSYRWLFTSKTVTICKCNKCGKLKRFVTEIP